MAVENIGGLLVDVDGDAGALVTSAGQVQFGAMLMGAGTSAGWRELVGWRDAPPTQVSDSPRPQSHGEYAGDVLGDGITITYTFLLRGSPEAKLAALQALELHAPLDGVERALVVDDGDGPWLRMGRLIGRSIPQGKHFRHAPLECALQFKCADPRRYSLDELGGTVTLPMSSGGLAYPLTYPLDYGTSAIGSLTVDNEGSTAAPLLVTFNGPLTNPALITEDWSMAWGITLAAGETLQVDTAEGTALLNGEADRLYTIRPASDPLERCLLKPGTTTLSLSATAGTGQLAVTYRHARL